MVMVGICFRYHLLFLLFVFLRLLPFYHFSVFHSAGAHSVVEPLSEVSRKVIVASSFLIRRFVFKAL